MECIFCKIISKDINAEIVYEDETSLAFMDINPCSDGHVLLIPKKHVYSIEDMDDESIGALFSTLKKVLRAVKQAMNTDAANIGWNNGKAAGQLIEHFHIHIIPRHENDGGGSIDSIIRVGDKDKIHENAEKIRRFLK